jgi:prepilin-type N-terminal cleavage/methylation domain-containing protein
MFKMFEKSRRKKGFTLIELIVVIAILAILAVIAIPRLLGFQDRAKEQADKQTAVQIRNAVALLHANGEITGSGTIILSTGEAWTIPDTIDPVEAGKTVEGLIEELTGNAGTAATDGLQVVGSKDIHIELGDNGEVTQSLVAPVVTP